MKPTFVQEIERTLESLRQFEVSLERARESGAENANCQDLLVKLPSIDAQLAQILQGLQFQEEFELLRYTAMLLASVVDEDQVLSAILEGLKRALSYDAAGIFLILEDPQRGGSIIRAQKVIGYSSELISHDRFRQKVDEGILGWVIRNARGEIVDDVHSDPRYIEARPETQSEIAVPIISKSEVIGCINLESDRPAAFRPENLRLLDHLASYTAVVLDRTEMMREVLVAREIERELEIARDIQAKLLPKSGLEVEGYDIAGLNVPSLEVGGDYYDLIRISDEDVGLVIADVAGKGVAAGLVMSGLRAALRARIETVYSIRRVVADINRFLVESTGAERFVTAFYGVLHLPTGRLTFVNAGHNPPVLISGAGEVKSLAYGGPVLGVIPNAVYEQGYVDLDPGSLLVMVTDGILEAGGEAGEEYGEQRLVELVQSKRRESADQLVHRIDQEAVAYHADRGELDDRTVIVVKRA